MTVNEMQVYINRNYIKLEGLTVKVIVLDVRQVFNRIDALITTSLSSTEKWIDASRLFNADDIPLTIYE